MDDQSASDAHFPAGTDALPSVGLRKEQHPFHAQLDDLNQSRAGLKHEQNAGEPRSFDLRQMASTLPPAASEQPSFEARRPSEQYSAAGMMGTTSFQYPQQMAQYGQQRHDPTNYARTQQQQHYVPQQTVPQAAQYRYANRPHPPQMQTQPPFVCMEACDFGASPPKYSQVDMRFPQQAFPMGCNPTAGFPDISGFRWSSYPSMTITDTNFTAQYARRTSETITAAVPSLPRGPPRKPKQSGHALWVGNLPHTATVTDLKDHSSRDATSDIQSLFLISKSNCAFVNYRSEVACIAAMNRYHDSRFNGVRLVCRLRRGSAGTTITAAIAESSKVASEQNAASKVVDASVPTNEPSDPIIVVGVPAVQAEADGSVSHAIPPVTKVPEKFFIIKSLTLQDLEASLRNGVWATQSHNENTLNQAFNAAENVYLIFSANKSGEYFGYARMCSEIAGEAVSIDSAPSPQRPTSSDGPKSIPTPATATAPRGHIIDDSARGTIFWEAETTDEKESASPDEKSEEGSEGQDLGRPFKIEWVSISRLPFYRTRGLRNPWNANREVKIARDGTEVEPSIGKRLVQMFHRPAHVAPRPMQASNMPYPPFPEVHAYRPLPSA